jgi:hypothetical protein
MARIVDTSRARCRTCGKRYKVGEALYSLASRIVDEGEQRFLKEFEHANCHVPIGEAIAQLREELHAMTERTKF